MHEYQTMGHILIVAVNPFHAWKIPRQRKNEKNAAPVNLIMGFLFYEYAVIVIAWLALQYGISCNVMGIRIDLSIYLFVDEEVRTRDWGISMADITSCSPDSKVKEVKELHLG